MIFIKMKLNSLLEREKERVGGLKRELVVFIKMKLNSFLNKES